MTQKTRELVWNKYGHRCAYCGKPLPYEKMQVDHLERLCPRYYDPKGNKLSLKVAIACYGDGAKADYIDNNSIDNLMPTCYGCNHYKGKWDLEFYRQLINKLHLKMEEEYLIKRGLEYGIVKIAPWDGKFFFEKYDPAIHPTLEFQEVKPERLTFEEFAYRELSKHGEQHIMKGWK